MIHDGVHDAENDCKDDKDCDAMPTTMICMVVVDDGPACHDSDDDGQHR